MQFSTSKTDKIQTAQFFQNLEFSDKSVVATPILESDFGKEIRIAFKEGQIMKEHKTKYPITVMTLKGNIEFSVGKDVFVLATGGVIALSGGVMHALKATEESVVRLSLHKSDSLDRVKGVLEL